MKSILLILSFSIFLILNTNVMLSEFTKNDKPEPMAAAAFKFPQYKVETLKNGIKIFFINDDEQPTLEMRVLVGGGSSADGEKSGIASLTYDMLLKGAKGFSAGQIAEEFDSRGASMYANASTDYGSINLASLTKHLGDLFPIYKSILFSPTFPEDELRKLKSQYKTGLMSQKSNPGTLASRLSKVVLWGEDSPYAKFQTEESIESITIEDVKKYYKKYFNPKNITIAVSGDISNDLKGKIYDIFSEWKTESKEKFQTKNIKKNPKAKGVYFIPRPGSVQTTISIITNALEYKSPKFERLKLAGSVLGASFTGRLFRTLREKYSFTYTPHAYVYSNKYLNMFSAGADVKKEVTDSSITVILEQMEDIRDNGISTEEFSSIRKYVIGKRLMSFESSNAVSNMIQNADFKGVNTSRLEKYTEILEGLRTSDIQNVYKYILNSDNAQIIVVGSPEIKESLEKFGIVYEYDMDILPSSGAGAKLDKVDISAGDLIEEYQDAIGGKDELDAIKTMSSEGELTLSVQGQEMKGSIVEKRMAPDKMYKNVQAGPMVQKQWFSGSRAWTEAGGRTQEAPQIPALQLLDARTFGIANIIEQGWACEVKGKNNGKIVMDAKNGDDVITCFFDEKTYLLLGTEITMTSPQGSMMVKTTYSDYKKYGEIMLPETTSEDSPMFSTSYKVKYILNPKISESDFEPSKE
jgi:zinc protease